MQALHRHNLIYKFIYTGLPHYFSPHIKPYTCARDTRSSDPAKLLLYVPPLNKVVSSPKLVQSFSYDGPKLWNDLPDDIRLIASLPSFRNKLKAYLFSEAYPP